MKPDQEQVISKIKKLLAMTESNGCTQEEAAVAIAHAQLLMAKYDIQMTELSEEEKSIIEEKSSFGTKSVSSFQSMLAATLAPHFGVRIITCRKYDGSEEINIIGDKLRSAIFKESYLFAYKAFQHQWKAFRKSNNIQQWQIAEFRGSYFKGFCDGIENEIQISENANAIVIRENPEIENYINQRFPHLRTQSIRLRGISYGDAYNKGYEDGAFSHRNKNSALQEMEERS